MIVVVRAVTMRMPMHVVAVAVHCAARPPPTPRLMPVRVSRTSISPTANSFDRPSQGGMTTPDRTIALPTVMTVMV
jgi:hypothetical protein